MLAFSPSTSDVKKKKISILYESLENVCGKIQTLISPFLERNFDIEDYSAFEYERIFTAALMIQTEINERLLPQYRADPERIFFKYGSKTIVEELNELLIRMDRNLIIDPEHAKGSELISFLEFYSHELSKIYLDFSHGYTEHLRTQEFISNLEEQLNEAKSAVKNIESAKRAIDGQKTEEIYSKASEDYLEAARIYEILFYMVLGTAFVVTIICLIHFPYSKESAINFIMYKVLTITFVITLSTLFLRKAAHLRKLHEQAHQTSLELQALPLYLANVTKEGEAEIYRDLASKYFGKELDKTQHDKIGDLMNEQIKTSLEVFKTSTEIVKSLKPSLKDTSSASPRDQKNPAEN